MNKTTRRTVIKTGLAASAMTALGGCQAEVTGPLNFLFIMADDLGFADLSCFGRDDYETPNLDALAKEGMKFTHAYSNSPVCSPTRVALMTGNYQARIPAGLDEPLGTTDSGLNPTLKTIPTEFGKLGYTSSLVGKWHLGNLPKYGPLQSGYDHFWGLRSGGIDYFRHTYLGADDLWDGDTTVEQVGYITDMLGEKACEAIEQSAKDKTPFFVSLHFNAPHWPWQGPSDTAEADRLEAVEEKNPYATLHFDGGSNKTYAAMVERLDMQVGNVLKKLKQLKLDKNTVVIFTSDNGGERFSKNWPFSGQKGTVLEGGIRVPTIVRWPGLTQAGTVSEVPILTMDWMPTLLSAVQKEPLDSQSFDGRDLRKVLQGEAMEDRLLFWRHKYMSQKACRLGDWKYLEVNGNSFLFNIAEDTLERANLKLRHAEKYEELKSAWERWNETMLPISPESFTGGIGGEYFADRPWTKTYLGTTPPTPVKN